MKITIWVRDSSDMNPKRDVAVKKYLEAFITPLVNSNQPIYYREVENIKSSIDDIKKEMKNVLKMKDVVVVVFLTLGGLAALVTIFKLLDLL